MKSYQLPSLPDSTKPILEEMNTPEPQGATRRIKQINNLFVAICEGWKKDPEALVETLEATGNYYIATRGKNTPAIGNAIRQTLHGISDMKQASGQDIQEFIRGRRDDNNAALTESVDIISKLGANLFSNHETILAFDYSGTVMGVLREMAERGHHVKLIVPESRSIQGGYPIVRKATQLGHKVHLIVDMAFPSFLGEAQAVIIGAETFFADGDCWNTIGGEAISQLAKKAQVPFYVATALIKVDPDSFLGLPRVIKEDEFKDLFQYPERYERPEQIQINSPDLDRVKNDNITAYLTEKGILSPEQVYFEARSYLEAIGAIDFGTL
jgi:ribose 1,5-bisphosphate isomerase